MEYNRIQNAGVDVGVINWIFKTGTVRIFSGETGSQGSGDSQRVVPKFDTFQSIQNAYQVLKLIQDNTSKREDAEVDVLESINKEVSQEDQLLGNKTQS